MRRIKWLAFGIAVLLLFGTTGCGKKSAHFTDLEYHSGSDLPYYLSNFSHRYIAESPDGYYYISGTQNGTDRGFLRFVDKKTQQDIVVCGKPDCLHGAGTYSGDQEREAKCNAFVMTYYSDVFYYDGYIYMITTENVIDGYFTVEEHFYLTQIAPDGSSRKNIYEITFEEELKDPGIIPFNYFLHRGRFYFCISGSPKDEPETHKVYWYSYDLNTGEQKLIKTNAYSFQEIIPLGDRIYFAEEQGFSEEEFLANYQYYTISTGEFTVMEEEFRNHFFYDGGYCYCCWEDDLSQEDITRCSFFDYDGNITKTKEIPGHMTIDAVNKDYILGSQETYYYNEKTGDKVPGSAAGGFYGAQELENQGYVHVRASSWDVYDAKTMALVDTLAFPEGELLSVYLLENQVMVFDMVETKIYFADLADLGTDNFEWKLAEKIN